MLTTLSGDAVRSLTIGDIRRIRSPRCKPSAKLGHPRIFAVAGLAASVHTTVPQNGSGQSWRFGQRYVQQLEESHRLAQELFVGPCHVDHAERV